MFPAKPNTKKLLRSNLMPSKIDHAKTLLSSSLLGLSRIRLCPPPTYSMQYVDIYSILADFLSYLFNKCKLQAGAELCQAQEKLGIATPALFSKKLLSSSC
jgi:hypothetical protein